MEDTAMRKLLLACVSILLLNIQYSISNPLQAQGFDWHRFNIAADFSYQPSALNHGSGILKQHPGRALHLGVNYRLKRRSELGAYTYRVGAWAWSSGDEPLGNGQRLHWIGWDNGYEWGCGLLVQYHTIPFDKRNTLGVDMVLRLGMDLHSIEADRLWCGVGFLYRFSRHMSVSYGLDVGSFHYSWLYNRTIGSSDWGQRIIIGLQYEL